MSFIKWRDSYNTGVEQFDNEHQTLVALVDLMFGAVRDKRGTEVVSKASVELVAYADSHFLHEEQAMEAVAYAGLEEHKAEHALLRTKAEQFRSRIDANDPKAAVEFYHFLREWLQNHILMCDRAYGPALKDWGKDEASPSI